MRRGSGSVVVGNHSRSGKVRSFKFDSKLDKSLIKTNACNYCHERSLEGKISKVAGLCTCYMSYMCKMPDDVLLIPAVWNAIVLLLGMFLFSWWELGIKSQLKF